MTFRYLSLAIGRHPRYRGIFDIKAYDKNGNAFPAMDEDEEMFRLWTRKVIDYKVIDSVMHCRLEATV